MSDVDTRPVAERPAKTPLVKEIPPKADDLSEWYQAVCYKAELVSLAPVRGCIVLRPYGFGLWERLQSVLDARFKETGHENAYFPLLIPESLLTREAQHVEGFAPEVAWVTEGGNEKLTERLAIRPTSEVTIGTMYAEWVQSYRDLPILINQWVNVMRWEKRTRPFLRTLEFLWQEGHTAHASEAEAAEEVQRMLEIYREVSEEVAGVPVYVGEKSASERFAGATHTFSIEALMPDGRALQAATSHELGQNFSKAYDIKFAAEDQTVQFAWTTSWGMSWRMLGALIMVHGDDRGLRIPPKMAPIEAVIVPIVRAGSDDVTAAARELYRVLKAAGLRVKLDERDLRPGNKFADWEMRGVPLRIELGAKDLAGGVATLVRRDKEKGEDGGKQTVPLADVAAAIPALLDDIQANLLTQARAFLSGHTLVVTDRDEFFARCKQRAGMIDIAWCGLAACEAAVKAETSASTRNLRPLDTHDTACVACGEPAIVRAYFAQSY
ncbi:MAG: proline--tRNA ligase [Candidatus Eremiobacteraeota bacterium]|nr:proline--tRNA ligase [Candidatus Eremiobacteraeota bacterium]